MNDSTANSPNDPYKITKGMKLKKSLTKVPNRPNKEFEIPLGKKKSHHFEKKEVKKKELQEIIGTIQRNIFDADQDYFENLPFKKTKEHKLNSTQNLKLKSLDPVTPYQDVEHKNIEIPIDPGNNNCEIKDDAFDISKANLKNESQVYFDNFLTKKFEDRTLKKYNNVYESNDDNQEEYFDNNSKWTINPNTKSKILWDLLIFLLILYTITVSFFRMCFGLYSEYSFLDIIEVLIDVFFIIDFILQFFVAYYDKQGVIINNNEKIILNYLNRWMIFDMISCFPSNLISFFFYISVGKINSLFSMNVLKSVSWLKIARFFKMGKKGVFGIIFRRLNITSNKALNRVIKFSLIMVLLVHISSCLWIYIGFLNYNETWIKANNLSNSSAFDIYMASFYFNLVTVYTIGYGDITATNNTERVFNMAFMLIGGFLFSFTISCLSMIFFSLNSKKLYKKNKLGLLNTYKNEYNLSEKLCSKIQKTIKHQIKASYLDKYSVLDYLSNNLKNELHLIMNKKSMNNFNIFNNRPNQFVMFLLPLLRPIVTSKGDALFSAGEFVEEVYFVKQGILTIEVNYKFEYVEIAKIRKNNHFGEILMYSNEQSPYYLRVKTRVSEIFTLKKQDFSNTKLHFDRFMNEVLENSYKMIQQIERRKRVLISLKDLEINSQEIQLKLNQLNYDLINRNFVKIYHDQKLEDFDAFDYLAGLEEENLKDFFVEEQLDVKEIDKRIKMKRSEENNFLTRLSHYSAIRNSENNNSQIINIKSRNSKKKYEKRYSAKNLDRLKFEQVENKRKLRLSKTFNNRVIERVIGKENERDESKPKKKKKKKEFEKLKRDLNLKKKVHINSPIINIENKFQDNRKLSQTLNSIYKDESNFKPCRSQSKQTFLSKKELLSKTMNEALSPKKESKLTFVSNHSDFFKGSKSGFILKKNSLIKPSPFYNFEEVVDENQLNVITHQQNSHSIMQNLKKFIIKKDGNKNQNQTIKRCYKKLDSILLRFKKYQKNLRGSFVIQS